MKHSSFILYFPFFPFLPLCLLHLLAFISCPFSCVCCLNNCIFSLGGSIVQTGRTYIWMDVICIEYQKAEARCERQPQQAAAVFICNLQPPSNKSPHTNRMHACCDEMAMMKNKYRIYICASIRIYASLFDRFRSVRATNKKTKNRK